MNFMLIMTLLEALIASLVKSEIYALTGVTLAILTVAEAINERGEK